MAYAGSRNLRREMLASQRRQRVNWEHVVGVAIEIGEALAYLHEQASLVHGDMKPENVVVAAFGTPQQQVVLTDFGLARLQNSSREDALAGTLAYLAPEQLSGTELNGRSADLYALGVILYEWVSGGKLPVPVRSWADARRKVPHYEPDPLPQTVPVPLATIIMKLLAKRQTAVILTPKPSLPPSKHSTTRSKHQWACRQPLGHHLTPATTAKSSCQQKRLRGTTSLFPNSVPFFTG